MGDRLYQKRGAVHALQTFPDHFHHIFPQRGAGLMQSGRIQQNDLRIVPVDHAADTISRCLRLITDNGDFFPDQSVCKAGFAHVGPSADGGHDRFPNFRHWLSSLYSHLTYHS